ncbi:hypothetical protein MVEN_00284400 [Mycena venus]|uniref:Uncharacterized protein n=1 Tax=Mycena venus TaxID=2733690 RepID=A0A8H6Z5B5_9AGAR|nr:hypothetical protein MVEN_00284400 [Mycena venus]
MSSEKCRFNFPAPGVVSPPTPLSRARRFARLAAELLLTACMSSAILLAIFCLLGIEEDRTPVAVSSVSASDTHFRPHISVLGILSITTACSVLLYAVVEGAAALVRSIRSGSRRRSNYSAAPGDDGVGTSAIDSYGACGYDGMRALEAGWRPVLAIADGRRHTGKAKPSVSVSPVNTLRTADMSQLTSL